MFTTIITFALILLILVLIHELGHFIVAKKIGVKVEEFAFGFPPHLFSFKKGETQYSINALPIGGYVKLYGEDEAGGGRIKLKVENLKLKVADENRAYYAQKPSHKLYIGIAGVVMNALLTILIFYIYFFISNFRADLSLFPNTNPNFFLATEQRKNEIVVTDVVKGSPADQVGMKVPSIITKINGVEIKDTSQFSDIVSQNKGKEITISWKSGQKSAEFTKAITPRVSPPPKQGAIGIAFYSFSTISLLYDQPFQKIFSGIVHPVNLMKYNFEVMGKLISQAFKTKNATPLSNSVAGPIGIYSIVGTIVANPNLKERALDILNLMGLLSMSLAFFNILPIPALDGGRVFFILIEIIVGKRLNPKVESYINSIGIALLLTLLLVTTLHDIIRQFAGKGF